MGDKMRETIILYMPNNETRVAYIDEYVKMQNGDIVIVKYTTIKEYPIYKKIEISIPDMALYFKYSFTRRTDREIDTPIQVISVYEPNLIKKWKWEDHITVGCVLPYTQTTEKEYTEKEMTAAGYMIGDDKWHKILESEIEVEE